MSTRLNKHKMCTKGSFIFWNHVHSYMELPITGLTVRERSFCMFEKLGLRHSRETEPDYVTRFTIAIKSIHLY